MVHEHGVRSAPRGGGSRALPRTVRGSRRPMALALLIWGAVATIASPTPPLHAQHSAPTPVAGPTSGPSVEEIAAITVSDLPSSPLFVGLAQVVVPPGVRTATAGTVGPRLLAIEAGTLTVALTERGEVVRAAATSGPTGGTPVLGGDEVVLGPGDRLTVAAGGIRELRNDAARSSVFLDAAIFPPGAEPVDASFTTAEGVSFQLLTGGVVEAIPAGPVVFALRRMRLDEGSAWPSAARVGPAVAYVESGSFDLVPTAGEVRFGRAAGAAAASTAGALRPIAVGGTAAMTAGAAALTETGSAMAARNARDVPAVILLVEVLPTA